MLKPLIYLAGPIGGCSYAGATCWRDEFTNMLQGYRVKCVNPMRGKETLIDEVSIDDIEYTTPLTCAKGIYTRDRWDCLRCSLMVANLLDTKCISIGTIIEWGWANSKNTPIIMVMEENNIHNHVIVKGGPGFRVDTLREAVYLARDILDLESTIDE